MFDPNKPYNDLPQLPPNSDLNDIDILKKVNTANMALSELKGCSLSIPNRAMLVEPLSVREAVASSGIENINTTVADVFKAELQLKGALAGQISQAQKETLHYRDALRVGYKIIQNKQFLNTNAYLEIQKILEPNKYGIRTLDGTKIVNSKTKEVIYTPPSGEGLIRSFLQNYENYFNENQDDIDDLIKMAILHYQFEAIHPFYDGNGRTGRILMVLYLIMKDRLELPILFISGYINKHRSEYYSLLGNVTEKSDWKNWILFVLEAVETQAKETNQTVLSIKELQHSFKDIVKKEIPTVSAIDMVEYLFANPFYTQQQFAKVVGVHKNTAGKHLNFLLSKKFLESFDVKNEKMYYNPQLLKLLE